MKSRTEISPERALERLEALCARSEQCTFDIMRKLAAWRVGRDDSLRIIESLQERRFVDDARFARAFCRDKYRFDRWGRLKIRAALVAKRIPRTIIDEGLAEIDEEIYGANLLAVLRAKCRSMKLEGTPTFEDRAKLARYAAGRGYEPSLVISVINSGSVFAPDESDL